MPLLASNYRSPFWSRNGFVATVYSGIARKVNGVEQIRERITLNDGDFIDLDWSFSKTKTNKLLISLHGLEGNANRPYMLGKAKLFNQNKVDVVSINLRGCSGEPNTKYRSYNSGATEDLHDVINFVLSNKNYNALYLTGISLGGNIILKYLGERTDIDERIKGAATASVPCSLYGSCVELHKFKNYPFAFEFLRHLKQKLVIKQQRFPERISNKEINAIKTLKQFDDVYTSRAHGYKDALDYYEKCSSLQFLPNIKIPTLLINALNDSFLSQDCYPYQVAESNPNLYFETPKFGGHVGFISPDNVYYNEKRALEFLTNY